MNMIKKRILMATPLLLGLALLTGCYDWKNSPEHVLKEVKPGSHVYLSFPRYNHLMVVNKSNHSVYVHGYKILAQDKKTFHILNGKHTLHCTLLAKQLRCDAPLKPSKQPTPWRPPNVVKEGA